MKTLNLYKFELYQKARDYKDKMKFGFNARGSLYESLSWAEILLERELITLTDHVCFLELNKLFLIILPTASFIAPVISS
jgi:hypothetical protein